MGIESKWKEIEKRQLRKKKLKISVKEINSAGNEEENVERKTRVMSYGQRKRIIDKPEANAKAKL